MFRNGNPALSGSRGIGATQTGPHRRLVGKTSSSQGQFDSQMVPENRAESDSSHVFPEYSQLVPDRTRLYRPARGPACSFVDFDGRGAAT